MLLDTHMTAITLLATTDISKPMLIPLFSSKVAAGFPSPASDYIEKTLDLNELCIQHPAATYFVRAEGDSMIDAGIFPGDVLIVDRALEATHGDIVIASLNGALTVKKLLTKPMPKLVPMNANYTEILITEHDDFELFGVVTNVIHSLKRTSGSY